MSAALTVAEAHGIVLASCAPLGSERVPLGAAAGRVLASDAVAAGDVPGFDNSAMDGFAVRSRDGDGPRRVVGESRAGALARVEVGPGEAVRISTGAALPAGADAVVPREQAREAHGVVTLDAPVAARAHVRGTGDDVRAGAVVLRAGTLVGPAELGVLAAIGVPDPAVHARPRVAVVVTGDELVDPGSPLRPGEIHDANGVTVPALAAASGADVTSVERAGDDPAATLGAIEGALSADVVVVCGGVSVGEHDHVRGALAAARVEEAFWRIALRPGGPTWFGRRRGGALVFGLPGNPVSAYVTFVLLVRPALRALAGAAPDADRTAATLTEDVARLATRDQAVRVRLALTDGGWRATPTGPQGSHVMTSLLGADGLAMIGAGDGAARTGDRVDVELL